MPADPTWYEAFGRNLPALLALVGGCVATTAVVVWAVTDRMSKGQIESLKERIALRDDQLKARDSELAELRALVEERNAQTRDQKGRLIEIVLESLAMASRIRGIVADHDRDTRRSLPDIPRDALDGERSRAFSVQTMQMLEDYQRYLERYNEIRGRAIWLRDQLLEALGDNVPILTGRGGHPASLRYEQPVNSFGMNDVADHLELLAHTVGDRYQLNVR